MFTYINTPICPECEKNEEIAFQKLKDYLNDNPGYGLAVISRETGVSIKKILKYIQEGRLEMTAGMAEDNPLQCTRCGARITIGTLCDECRNQYNQAVIGLKEDTARSKTMGTGMHSKQDDEKRRR